MIEGIPIIGLTAPGLLGITVLLLLIGKIVPRSVLQDKIDESNRWREAYKEERAARALADKQTAELLELAKTTNSVISAVFGDRMLPKSSGDELDATTTP